MIRSQLALAAAIALSLTTPICTQAAPFTPGLNFAYDLAIQYWGREPAACVSVEKQIVTHGSLDNAETQGVAGRATQVPSDAPAASLACTLWIDRTYVQPLFFNQLCAVMVHEVGHLLGKQHSLDPSDVMNVATPIPLLCRSEGRRAKRLYLLRTRLHRLRLRSGADIGGLRRQARRELQVEAQRFWSLRAH